MLEVCCHAVILSHSCDFKLFRQSGVAVGAGEVEEETAKALTETRQELEEVTRHLTLVRDENQQLRVRIAWLESEGEAAPA